MQNHCGPREVAREGLDLELERSSDSLTLTPQFRKQVVLQLSPDWGAGFGTVERKRWGVGTVEQGSKGPGDFLQEADSPSLSQCPLQPSSLTPLPLYFQLNLCCHGNTRGKPAKAGTPMPAVPPRLPSVAACSLPCSLPATLASSKISASSFPRPGLGRL